MALSLSSVASVLARIDSSRDVAFGTYFLPPGGARAALLAAASRGAHVEVTLQSDPYRNPFGARCNASAARELRGAGASVTLLDGTRTPFHLKAAVCDGVAYLDDRNWTKRGPETVIADDDPSDVALVRDALRGRGGADAALATRKDEALRREVDLIDRAGRDEIIVESETVATSPLTRALQRHARAGAATTLILPARPHSRREASVRAALARSGVRIRTGGTNEKLALAGDRAWIGSGNATGATGRGAGQVEFGFVTRERALVAAVRSALARDAGTG